MCDSLGPSNTPPARGVRRSLRTAAFAALLLFAGGAQALDSVSNTATVEPPSGISDPVVSNNSATDTDTLQVLRGRVFNDGGAGTTTPNDGIAQVSEPGLNGITVSLTDCATTVYATATTTGGGDYSLQPVFAAVGNTVCVVVAPQAGQIATGASVDGTATPSGTTATNVGGVDYTYTRATSSHSQSFTMPANNLSELNFGLVGISTFGANSNLPGVANSTVRHSHQFVAATGGVVTFSIASSIPAPATAAGAWSEKLFRDTNCDGTLSAAEATLQIPPTAVVQGQTICLVMEQFIPAAVASGGSNTVVVQAVLVFDNANPALSTTATLTDVTTVGASAVLVRKEVRNVTTDDVAGTENWSVTNGAKPGDVLEYRITYINNAPAPVTQLVLSDTTPAFTSFISAAESSAPAGLSGTCQKNTPFNPAPAATVACADAQTGALTDSRVVTWKYTGSLQPSATGAVVFRVVVDAP